MLCGPSCWWHLLLVVLCGHQCTSAREWSVRAHLGWGLSVVYLWCTIFSVVCPSQLFCSAWICCLEVEYYMFVIVICLMLLLCTLPIRISVFVFSWSKLCMSVVVYVMLSLMSVMSPPPVLRNLSVRTAEKLCTYGVYGLGVCLVFWIVVISACVSWINSLTSSSLFWIPFMLNCSMMRFSHFYCLVSVLCGICSHVVVFGLSVR